MRLFCQVHVFTRITIIRDIMSPPIWVKPLIDFRNSRSTTVSPPKMWSHPETVFFLNPRKPTSSVEAKSNRKTKSFMLIKGFRLWKVRFIRPPRARETHPCVPGNGHIKYTLTQLNPFAGGGKKRRGKALPTVEIATFNGWRVLANIYLHTHYEYTHIEPEYPKQPFRHLEKPVMVRKTMAICMKIYTFVYLKQTRYLEK